MNRNENPYASIVARGYNCPRCKAWADEPCVTPSGKATSEHKARHLRAGSFHLLND